MSRCFVRREAADSSLVHLRWASLGRIPTPRWGTNERAERAPCHGVLSAAKRRTAHWCTSAGHLLDVLQPLGGALMSERSELHVTVFCPPRSGGQLIGAPPLGISWTYPNPSVV